MPRPRLALIAALLAAPAPAADPIEFVPLFNGKDLSGWVNVNTAPGTFSAKDGEVVTTGTPTGFLRTARPYENFVLEMDWLHENKTAMGNSGLFVWGDPLPAVGTGYTRGIEVQVLVNYEADWATSHGDLFSIWGAKCVPDRPHPKGYERCLPSERRCKGGGEWNHYKVTANDGTIKLEVNGKEVSGVSKCNPRKGYLALESEGAVCHFKNLRVKELPSTNPKPEECADGDEGFVSLFDGLDLNGWKTDKGAWTATDGVLKATGTAGLTSNRELGSFEFLFDSRLPAKTNDPATTLRLGGVSVELAPDGPIRTRYVGPSGENKGTFSRTTNPGGWDRVRVRRGPESPGGGPARMTFTIRQEHGREWQAFSFAASPAPPGRVLITPAAGLELRNVFVRELKEK